MPNSVQVWCHLPQPPDQETQTLKKSQPVSQKAAYPETMAFPALVL